ncbi:unnamed protein product, partial [Phaeothamnion confervicola]
MSVTLSSVAVTTDDYAVLSVSDVRCTSVTLYWKNMSANAATFRILQGDDRTTALSGVSVDGKATTSQTIRGLTSGTAYKFVLQRDEFGTYVDQTSNQSGSAYALVNTLHTSLSLAVASSSGTVQWPQTYSGASYTLTYIQLQDGVSTGSSTSITDSNIVLSAGVHKATLASLSKNTSYEVALYVNESQPNGTASVLLDSKTLTTSDSVQMAISGIYASYANLSWSGDGSTYYRIIDDSGKVRVSPTLDSVASVTNLTPGTTYNLILQALQLDGTYATQSWSTVVARSTALTVAGVGSSSISLQWNSLYDAAHYSVRYTTDQTTWKEYSVTSFTDVAAVLTSLVPGTAYTI